MIKPLTDDMVTDKPLLYKNACDVRSEDVASALKGLKKDILSMSEIDEDVKRSLIYYVDCWFQAFEGCD